MDLDTYIFGIIGRNVSAASLIHVFLILTAEYPENSGQSTTNPVHLSSIEENTKYLGFSYLLSVLFHRN